MRLHERIRTCARIIIGCALGLAFADPHVAAQEYSPPRLEVRAVWLTTHLGLDWPPSSLVNDPTAQQSSLRTILRNIASMNLNTVMFQVRSRGNAMFLSALEPASSELTGQLGRDPGWDPLAFAVREAHALGMEIHAWINVFRVWTGTSPPPRTRPEHLYHSHPDWLQSFGSEMWVDPGVPEARRYVIDLCTDLARRYDVDGIHLDYVRYPESSFDDADTYARYGNGKPKAAWRQENINALVRGIYTEVTRLKPWLKVGSAPIGIYENLPTAKGWQGLHTLSQDSRRWLREGYHDYVAPQIYWGLSGRGSTIDFEALARDWQTHASGRHVYIGMAPYRPEVMKYLHEEVDVTRRWGAAGQCFFRYQFILPENSFRDRYRYKALPPPMSWKGGRSPLPPASFRVRPESDGTINCSWTFSGIYDVDGPSRMVLFRSITNPVDTDDPANIRAILPADAGAFRDTTNGVRWYYALSAINRYNLESRAVQESEALATRETAAAAAALQPAVSDLCVTPDARIGLIGFTNALRGHVRLRLMRSDGSVIATIIDEDRDPGTYLVGIDLEELPEEIASCMFEAGSYRVVRDFRRPVSGD